MLARYIRIVEVTGSNPVCSTPNPAFRCRIFCFNPRFCKVTLRKLQVCKRFDHNFDHNSKENIHLFHDIALRFHRRVRIVLRSTPFLMRRTADKSGNFPFHNNEEGNKHLVSN